MGYSAKHNYFSEKLSQPEETKEIECLNAMWCPEQGPKKREKNIKEKTAEILTSGS